MGIKTNDIAQAANILVSAGVMATGAGVLATAGAAVAGFLSMQELRKIIPTTAQSDLDWVTQELTKQLNNPNGPHMEDTRRLIPQMIEISMPSPEQFTEQGLQANALVDLMVEKIEHQATDKKIVAEMAWPETIKPFRSILLPILSTLLSDSTFTTKLAPQLWRETLKRQERIETKVDNVPQAVVDLLMKQGLIPPQEPNKIPLSDLTELAEKFGATAELDPVPLIDFLTKKAEEYRSYRALIDGLDERVAAIANLKGAAQGAAERLDFAEVDELLSRVDTVETEIAADTKQARAANALLRGRAQQAYTILTAAADSFASVDGVESSRRRRAYGKILYDYGFKFAGDALGLAVRMWGKAAADVDNSDNADLWATLQNDIGAALQVQGERESGTARLEQAVGAFRNALAERTQDRVPLQWAMTQNNLGNALSILGERESGTARLEQAVAAFHNALTEWTQEKVPLDWATTQTNLGNTLRVLGERESGTARLEQAVVAFHNALAERTQNKVPLDWAATHNNLGAALTALGEREGGTTRLEQAINSLRNALIGRTQDKVPLDWAMTQNNLGSALLSLGQRESGTERLQEAVQAFRNALSEWTQDRVPLQWATTQFNMGGVYLDYFDKTDEPAHLETAEAHVQAALAMFEQSAPHYAGMARELLQQIAARRAQG